MKALGRIARTSVALGAVSALVIGAGGLVAWADDISNSLDGTIDVTAELMSLTAAGAVGTTSLYVDAENGDGKNGCNLTGATTLVVSVNSSNPAAATTSPTSVTFGSCGDVKPLTVTPIGVGSTTISLSQTSNSTGGTFNLAPATFTVNVVSANTPPTLTLPANVTAEATSASGATVNYAATASDAQDGALTPSCSPVTGSTFPIGSTTVNCSVTDTGELTVSGSFTVTVQDTTEPLIIVPADTTAEASGPLGAGVSYSGVTASDAVDGALTPTCTPISGSTFALGSTTVSCSATDSRGNTGTNSFKVVVKDETGPDIAISVTDAEATSGAGATVGYTATATDLVDGDVSSTLDCSPVSGSTFPLGSTTLTCTAEDSRGNSASNSASVTVGDNTAPVLSLPDNITAEATSPDGADVTFTATATDIVDGNVDVTCDPASGSTFALGVTTVDCTTTDAAGNEATGSFDVTVQDTTAPTITWHDGPAVNGTYVFESVPNAPTCTAADFASGPKDCEVSGYGTSVGSHTMTATARDNAGNTATETRSYSVAAWTLRGFHQPVDMNGTWNIVKNGSTVPLKFEVFAGDNERTTTSSIEGFTVKGVACPTTGLVTDDIELTTTGGTSLRYDSTAGQFIQNWQTPKKAGACYTVTMRTIDGSSISANFKLR